MRLFQIMLITFFFCELGRAQDVLDGQKRSGPHILKGDTSQVDFTSESKQQFQEQQKKKKVLRKISSEVQSALSEL